MQLRVIRTRVPAQTVGPPPPLSSIIYVIYSPAFPLFCRSHGTRKVQSPRPTPGAFSAPRPQSLRHSRPVRVQLCGITDKDKHVWSRLRPHSIFYLWLRTGLMSNTSMQISRGVHYVSVGGESGSFGCTGLCKMLAHIAVYWLFMAVQSHVCICVE